MTEAVVTSAEIRGVAEDVLREVADGDGLDDLTAALIGLSVRAVVTTMDTEGSERYIRLALAAGATPAQVHEVLTVVAAIGMHTFFESSRQLARIAAELDPAAPVAADRELWAHYVGDDSYWARAEVAVPGFLDALLRMSPEAFAAFFEFCSVPWQSKTVPALTKELVSMACDATPGHRYLPAFRFHLANALRLGAGALAVRGALAIAEKAPSSQGVR